MSTTPSIDAQWRFEDKTGSWNCPGCGQRAALPSPPKETLVMSAKNAGLRTFGNGSFGDPGKWFCAACSHAPDIEERITAFQVARALSPGGPK